MSVKTVKDILQKAKQGVDIAFVFDSPESDSYDNVYVLRYENNNIAKGVFRFIDQSMVEVQNPMFEDQATALVTRLIFGIPPGEVDAFKTLAYNDPIIGGIVLSRGDITPPAIDTLATKASATSNGVVTSVGSTSTTTKSVISQIVWPNTTQTLNH